MSVTIPACEPVSEIASWPRSWIAIAASAQDTRSPTEISMSTSRGAGVVGDLVRQAQQLVRRVAHGREDGDDAVPALARRDQALRDGLDPRGVRDRGAAELHDDGARRAGRLAGDRRRSLVLRRCHGQSLYTSRRPESARPSVTSSAYSRSPPTGSPLARRVTRTRPRSRSAMNDAVASPVVFGFVARTTSTTPLESTRLKQLVDPEILGIDAVERRQGAAEHVVEAAVLVRPLQGHDVGGLLDDADDRPVAPSVAADLAGLVLGPVAALVAEAHALLRLLERAGERERLVRRRAEQVEGQPVRGPGAHPRKARQLRDEILDRRAEHAAIVPVRIGPDRRAKTVAGRRWAGYLALNWEAGRSDPVMASRAATRTHPPHRRRAGAALVYVPCPACGRGVQLSDDNRATGDDEYECPTCGARLVVSDA